MRRLLLASTLFALAACAGRASSTRAGDARKNDPVPAEKPLYERLGGLPGIEGLVASFLDSVLADPLLAPRFAHLDAEGKQHLRQMFIDQICEATFGPCQYSGKAMAEAHAGMNITDDEWNAALAALGRALDAHGVAAAEKDALGRTLAPLHDEIVGK